MGAKAAPNCAQDLHEFRMNSLRDDFGLSERREEGGCGGGGGVECEWGR